tara:strand:- start:19805 stop:21082 length:1278 start_codon:yes stop_codon:yes gene_type:complete
MLLNDIKLGIIGLGYVGLPLAVEFAKKKEVIGFDINSNRIDQLKKNLDSTLEVEEEALKDSKNLIFSSNLNDLSDCNCFIVTVPTPIDDAKQPNLEPLFKASEMIGTILKKGDLVIYESTVYPGATEEECAPILEEYSGLTLNKDFFLGYSPERINPGDKEHTVRKIIKITSGSTPEIASLVDDLYSTIIDVGTHKASSIKVAEAAKVIENTQRDVNIALINELSLIFNKLKIDTEEVLEAAGTKWNFLPFKPGLVGGHCIGVDPYYLTKKAESVGYNPEIILAGRKINDSMSSYVVKQSIKSINKLQIDNLNAKVLIMGITFKENCPDIRNSKVLDIIDQFKFEGVSSIDVYDPWIEINKHPINSSVNFVEYPNTNFYDCIILAVAHQKFIDLGIKTIKSFGKKEFFIYDLKFMFPSSDTSLRL